MDRVEFLAHRVAFCGVPYGELTAVLDNLRTALRNGRSERRAWMAGFAEAARAARGRADDAAREGRRATAADAWLEAAGGYQAASLGLHLAERPEASARAVRRFRRLARCCYERALEVQSARIGRRRVVPWPLRLEAGQEVDRSAEGAVGGRTVVAGYLHLPAEKARGVVVLWNGLDSIAEVEMHAFARPMVNRGLAALALDLPAGAGPEPSLAPWRAEAWTTPIRRSLDRHAATTGRPLASFGVSFGGHLAARSLWGDPRFVAAVAVSPAAYLSPRHFEAPRVRAMAQLAFSPSDGVPSIDGQDASLDLEAMDLRRVADRQGPIGRPFRLYTMDRDALFGSEHTDVLRRLAPTLEQRRDDAEHVGTSRIHDWLPEAADWLAARLEAASDAVVATAASTSTEEMTYAQAL